MPWARLDDQLWINPKVRGVSNDALALYVTAISYAAQALTDGFVEIAVVELLGTFRHLADVSATRDELVAARLWELIPTGIHIHDYLTYNPSRADVLAERAANTRRQAEWKARRVTNTITNTVTNGVTNAAPARPGPAHDHDPDLHDLYSGADAPREKPEPDTTVPKERPKPKHAGHFEAVLRGMGWCLTRCTDNERGQANKAAMQLDKAGYSTTDVDGMFAKWPVLFPGMRISPSAIANHAQELVNGTAPAGNGAPRGRQQAQPDVDPQWMADFLHKTGYEEGKGDNQQA